MLGMDPLTEKLPLNVMAWIKEISDICKPDDVYWCDGSTEEFDALCKTLVDAGIFIL